MTCEAPSTVDIRASLICCCDTASNAWGGPGTTSCMSTVCSTPSIITSSAVTPGWRLATDSRNVLESTAPFIEDVALIVGLNRVTNNAHSTPLKPSWHRQLPATHVPRGVEHSTSDVQIAAAASGLRTT